jgi:hypothetical protein
VRFLFGGRGFSHSRRSRRSCTVAGEWLTWGMTGAGTRGDDAVSSRIR